MNVGERIQLLRKQLGLSQSELAGKEVTREYISRIESGRSRPSPKILLFIAQQLNTSVEFILGNTSSDSEIEAHIDTSYDLYAKSNYEEALDWAYKAQTLAEDEMCSQPVKYAVRRQLGLCLLATRQYMSAAQVLEESLFSVDVAQQRDKYVDVLYLSANAHYLAQSFSRAVHFYELVIKYTENRKKLLKYTLQSWIYLGSSHVRNGDMEAAIEAYEHALRDTIVLNSIHSRIDCMMGLGWVYYKTKQLKKAITLTREAECISKANDNYNLTKIAHNLGIMFQDANLHRHATDMLSNCMDEYLSTEDSIGEASVLEDLALMNITLKDFHSAVDKLKKALSVIGDRDTHILRGRIYRALAIAYRGLQHPEYMEYTRIALGFFRLVGAQEELKNTLNEFEELQSI